MKTIVINAGDQSSAKLFLALAKKMHFEARILSDKQKENFALLSMMVDRKDEPILPIESVLKILQKAK